MKKTIKDLTDEINSHRNEIYEKNKKIEGLEFGVKKVSERLAHAEQRIDNLITIIHNLTNERKVI